MATLWSYTERPGKDFTRRRDAAIIRLFLASGIRAGEMAALRFPDVDLKAQTLRVGGKGRKWRVVPYSTAAAVALDRYLVSRPQSKWAGRTDHVWLSVKGHMTRSGIQQLLERTGDKLGIPGLHPHRLRHVCVDSGDERRRGHGPHGLVVPGHVSALCVCTARPAGYRHLPPARNRRSLAF